MRRIDQEKDLPSRSPFAGSILVFLLTLPLFTLLQTGCSHHMEVIPAPTATLAPGEKNTAMSADAGVTIDADGRAWSGHPYDLNRIMTPMEVRFKNDSSEPLQIRYKDMSLTTASGFTYHPLPPYRIRGEITHVEPVSPAFGFNRFYISPYYAPFYSWDFDTWGGPFGYDWGYYPQWYAVWQTHLPTRDMIRQAIPEGVLQSKGSLSGFVYFQKVDKKHQKESLTFTTDLVDAKTQKPFGKVTIPFEVKKQ